MYPCLCTYGILLFSPLFVSMHDVKMTEHNYVTMGINIERRAVNTGKNVIVMNHAAVKGVRKGKIK